MNGRQERRTQLASGVSCSPLHLLLAATPGPGCFLFFSSGGHLLLFQFRPPPCLLLCVLLKLLTTSAVSLFSQRLSLPNNCVYPQLKTHFLNLIKTSVSLPFICTVNVSWPEIFPKLCFSFGMW